MKDFTIGAYQALLDSLKENDYSFQKFNDFLSLPSSKSIILRHDVDDRKMNSLKFARLQHSQGVVGTYYFRIVPQSFDADVIREIYELGHEIGYHYEDMDIANGDVQRAIESFALNLEKLRQIAPVNTICMHGSPRSKFDNKALWQYYDYKAFGIQGEPYFDLDFNEVFYLTDTGRKWNGNNVSVRDKVEQSFSLVFQSTFDVITCIRQGNFPKKAMITFHPQRWTNDPIIWLQEKYTQQIKNIAKYYLIKTRQIVAQKH